MRSRKNYIMTKEEVYWYSESWTKEKGTFYFNETK